MSRRSGLGGEDAHAHHQRHGRERGRLVPAPTCSSTARRSPRSAASSGVTADRTIDAAGKLVIPGAIDVHTHMELPFGGTFAKDTFETGTRAAAFGGTTTIIDFAVQSRGASLREGLDAWHAKAEGNCAIDYGFHMIMSDVNDDDARRDGPARRRGRDRLQALHGLPGRLLLRRRRDLPGDAADRDERRARSSCTRRTASRSTSWPPMRSPPARPTRTTTASCATRSSRARRRTASSGSPRPPTCPVYIVHLSARDALRQVAEARDRGAKAFAETCPQYLFLSLDDMGNGFEGAKFVCSPPLRPADHQEDLWNGLVKDDLQVVSTDHCPFDFHGQKELGRGDFRKVPNGLPGVEDRLDLMHDGGVVGGRLTRERWVEVCSAAPARMFGLAGRKGVIAPGADADIVVYDPERRHVISATTHHMNVDYSCYEGREVQGGSDVVLSRGKVIIEGGAYTGSRGDGRFLARAVARDYLT